MLPVRLVEAYGGATWFDGQGGEEEEGGACG